MQYISRGFCHLEFVAPGSVPQGLEPVPLQLARFAVGRVTRCRDRGLGVQGVLGLGSLHHETPKIIPIQIQEVLKESGQEPCGPRGCGVQLQSR